LEVISVYVREAHPSETYPQHRKASQKMQHASDWVRMGERPWTVAVDTLEGETHLAYGPLPNCAYLIDRSGRVAYRALWAGQEHLLRMRIEELLRRDATGEASVNMGQQEYLVSC
ncbi:MAG: deiodinase-related protein, partial [Xanthomonadaceae bacterium]|nr:deiodinase-related protein [Xanthomonadaceae bacterium]